MQRAYLYWIGWSAIIALALWLRIDGLSDRSVHADEATGARILAERIEDRYQFNPKHFHGPFLSFISQPIAKFRGESDWSSLSVFTLRLGVVFAGLMTVLSPLLWIRTIGSLPALVASALLASSPLIVYYNRMYIHESWLVLFGLLSLFAIYRLLERPNRPNALIAGLFVGLMFATKETFIISIISWSLAAILFLVVKRSYSESEFKPVDYIQPITIGIITSLLVGAAFFTNWFTQPKSFLDAIQTFFIYETTPGHEKPTLYYLKLLIWPKNSLGVWWSEGIILLLGLCSIVFAFTKRKNLPLLSLILVSVLAHLVIYSSIRYKTPWLMLLPWAQACLLAALAFRSLQEESKLCMGILFSALALGLFLQVKQCRLATGSFSNDTRNPYVYVPTSNNLQSLQAWLEDLNAVQPIEPIAVIGSGYWPLPWYLKNFKEIGYWSKVNDDMIRLPVVMSMDAETQACADLLNPTHTQLPRSLRENVSITLFLRNDLWQNWNEETP